MLLEKIKEAGIVGCGGAGFPTYAKLNTTCEYFIINAAECEPLLKTDHYVMRHYADQCIQAIVACGHELQAKEIVIAIKGHYHEEIAALEQAIDRFQAPIKLHKMENFYPAGDEQIIVYEVTGRTVKPGGIPLSVGCVVSNISTMWEVYQATQMNHAVTDKYLTITGEVAHPQILKVPIGTSFAECIEYAGGTLIDEFIIVDGGPMMGKVIEQEHLDSAVVKKTTSGILILKKADYLLYLQEKTVLEIINEAKTACIQCSICTDLCPRHQIGHPLHPHKIMRQLSMSQVPDEIDDSEVWQEAQLCCACGICEVIACPMGLSPRQVNLYVKEKLREKQIPMPKDFPEHEPDPMRDYKKVTPKAIWYKMGIDRFAHEYVSEMTQHEARHVKLPLSMHIGAPSQPIVQVGDYVEKGQLVAQIPKDKLGANLHASISGVVIAADEKDIVIEKMEELA